MLDQATNNLLSVANCLPWLDLARNSLGEAALPIKSFLPK